MDKERPIALTAQEVSAMRARKKLQHRMPLEPQPYVDSQGHWAWESQGVSICIRFASDKPFFDAMQRRAVGSKAAPFKVGEIMWAQEEHRPIGWLMDDGEVMIEYRDSYTTSYNYLTDEELENNPNDDYPLAVIQELLDRNVPIQEDNDRFDFINPENLPHWRSAEEMPRFACRSCSEITKARIERIQDISEVEALASGLLIHTDSNGTEWFLDPLPEDMAHSFHRDDWRTAFSVYWNSLHGVGAWDRNDWVWVYDLKKANTYE